MNRTDACFELVDAAAAILAERVGRTRTTFKGLGNPVTEADHAAEAFLFGELRKRFPGDGFLGEEGAKEESRSGFLWVADPLDGTLNYAHGYPHYGVSLALLRDGEVLAGAVSQPAGEAYRAEKGAGAYLGSRRLQISEVQRLAGALAATDIPYDRTARLDRAPKRLEAMIRACETVRILGSCALEMCRVAQGALDLYVIEGTHAWDAAAAMLVLEQAGGRATDWDGKRLDPLAPKHIIASNGFLHEEALTLIEDVHG